MRTVHHFAAAVAGWSIALVITIIGTATPRLAVVAHLWQVVALAIAITTTLSLIASRTQAAIVEDLQTPPEERLRPV